MRDYLILYVNGKRFSITGTQLFEPLSDFLRYQQSLTGTKVVCAEGDCGACSVLLGRVKQGKFEYQVANSCILYLYQLDCQHIITVEGLRKTDKLHPVQQNMIDYFGSQCGYCTPGFVMAIAAMFEQKELMMTQQTVRNQLIGNLCRCTGYEPIIQAALAVDPKSVPQCSALFPESEMLLDCQKYSTESLQTHFEENIPEPMVKYFCNPVTLEEAVEWKVQHPQSTIVMGGTDLSVQMNKGRIAPKSILSLSNIPHLDQIEVTSTALKIGAKVTWTELEKYTQIHLPEFYKIIQVFASPQIKNVGTLVGNIVNASPIADSLPFLYVSDAQVQMYGLQGSRKVKINDFYYGYKQLALEKDEIITHLHIPFTQEGESYKLYKVSKRKDLDISTFTAGIYTKMDGDVISKIRIAYGGVGPVIIRLALTENFLQGKSVLLEHIQTASKLARSEVTPISDVRASEDYRGQLAENILFKWYHERQSESSLRQVI